MKRLALVDFDETIVMCDTLLHIFIREMYYLDLVLSFLLFVVVVVRFLFPHRRRRQIWIRNIFKKRFLRKFCAIRKEKLDKYVNYFRRRINRKLVSMIAGKYDTVVVISGSEERLIKMVLEGIFPYDLVIASKCGIDYLNFQTCWNENKVDFLHDRINIQDYDVVHLYTDSYDDLPLMEIVDEVFLIKGGDIARICVHR